MRNAGPFDGADPDEMELDEIMIDSETAERILAGEPAGPAGLRRLVAIAAAASASERVETSGEEEAVAAYRAARRELVGAPTATPGRRGWARLVTVKVAAVALALAAGGVAVAAGTGALPNLLPGRAPAPKTTVSPTVRGSDDVRSGPPSAAPATVPADLVGLCHAFLAAADRGEARRNPHFAALIAAAGTLAKVETYCAAQEPSAGSHPSGPPGSPSQGPPTQPNSHSASQAHHTP